MAAASSPVPCGSCTLCCHGKVFLWPSEDAGPLQVVVDRRVDGRRLRRLVQKPDGSCVHLGEGGCTVYEHRPRICREFDCRDHYHLPAAERRRREAVLVDPQSKAVIRRGRELVEADRGR